MVGYFRRSLSGRSWIVFWEVVEWLAGVGELDVRSLFWMTRSSFLRSEVFRSECIRVIDSVLVVIVFVVRVIGKVAGFLMGVIID